MLNARTLCKNSGNTLATVIDNDDFVNFIKSFINAGDYRYY